MRVCSNCGTESPQTFKFCPACATPLDVPPREPREERKVVSVLFVDLVGFVGRFHDADPEDVRAALSPYYQRLKAEIEHYGGTVEKFIGDAAVGVRVEIYLRPLVSHDVDIVTPGGSGPFSMRNR